MAIQRRQQENDDRFYRDYCVKMLQRSTVRQSGARIKERLVVIEAVGPVPQKHSLGCPKRKVFLLNYDMGTFIQIELSAILSPDIFAITQPLLWDQDKEGESKQVQTMLRNFTISACPSQCEQTEEGISG